MSSVAGATKANVPQALRRSRTETLAPPVNGVARKRRITNLGDAEADVSGIFSKTVPRGSTVMQKFHRQLCATLESDPVVEGFTHQGEQILREAFKLDKAATVAWVMDAVQSPEISAYASDILMLFARLDLPLASNTRAELVSAALKSDGAELRNAAVRAVEMWRDKQLIAVLRNHHDEIQWLQRYSSKIIDELQG